MSCTSTGKGYTIVVFLKEDTTEAVPTSWIKLPDDAGSEPTVAWPYHFSEARLFSAIFKGLPPECDWEAVPVKILAHATSWKSACSLANKAIDTSNISSESDEINLDYAPRRYKPNPRYNSEPEDQHSKRQKKLGDITVPCFPERHTCDNASHGSDDVCIENDKRNTMGLQVSRTNSAGFEKRHTRRVSDEMSNKNNSTTNRLPRSAISVPIFPKRYTCDDDTQRSDVNSEKDEENQESTTGFQASSSRTKAISAEMAKRQTGRKVLIEKNYVDTQRSDVDSEKDEENQENATGFQASSSRTKAISAEMAKRQTGRRVLMDKNYLDDIQETSSSNRLQRNLTVHAPVTGAERQILKAIESLRYDVNSMQKSVTKWSDMMHEYFKQQTVLIPQQCEHLTELLPISVPEDMNILECYLKDASEREKLAKHLSLKGGKDIKSATSNILAALLKNDIALQYSAHGKRNKKSFKVLSLFQVVLQAVRILVPCAHEDEIVKRVSKYLAGSCDRDGGRKSRCAQEKRPNSMTTMINSNY